MSADWEVELPGPEDTRRLGRLVGEQLVPGLVVALDGDLGAGKTAVCKAIVAAQGAVGEDDVVSPTFVLAVDYPGRVEVVHLDVYRLEGPEALADLALEPGGDERAMLIEWAERVAEALPPDRLRVELSHHDGGRRARLQAGGPRSAQVLEAVRAAWG